MQHGLQTPPGTAQAAIENICSGAALGALGQTLTFTWTYLLNSTQEMSGLKHLLLWYLDESFQYIAACDVGQTPPGQHSYGKDKSR